MKTLGIIPARIGSQRLKSKPLIELAGKPVIRRVWEQASKALLTDLFIATDSEEIKQLCESFGAHVIMTSSAPRTGSDRVAEAYEKLSQQGKYDLVLNIQGDMPFINPELINKCVEMCQGTTFDMATPVYPIYDKEIFERNSVVKAVFTASGNAIYFSRAPIPYPRFQPGEGQPVGFKHIGLYIFNPDSLLRFASYETGVYEAIEGLEQLRFIENGDVVKLLFVSEALCSPGIEIDTDEDVNRALQYIRASGID